MDEKTRREMKAFLAGKPSPQAVKATSKRAVSLRVAPATVAQVEELLGWLGAPSKNWIWEHAIERWHAQEEAKRAEAGGEGGVTGRSPI